MSDLAVESCTSKEQSWHCPNMKVDPDDLSMEFERYSCAVCGRTMKLDYDEMR